ncbi:hypothetical protein MSAN_02447800 [Mycena sanguinolenta]|uniref:Uncharacterized protein n=1 Tax=Mycena sanguinolenta TaxID=230812 RepID=A0A8H6WY28_9AGAR|nr:hypothetical protein MSAN_02447800 [Mycena sanguinolenta]
MVSYHSDDTDVSWRNGDCSLGVTAQEPIPAPAARANDVNTPLVLASASPRPLHPRRVLSPLLRRRATWPSRAFHPESLYLCGRAISAYASVDPIHRPSRSEFTHPRDPLKSFLTRLPTATPCCPRWLHSAVPRSLTLNPSVTLYPRFARRFGTSPRHDSDQIIDSYKEFKDVGEKRDLLAQRITDITGDICATVLRMEETNYSNQISRLLPDLKKYAELIDTASQFIKKYDNQGSVTHFLGRNPMQDEMDKLQQDLDLFSVRFGNNRLVDLCLQQSMNTKTLDNLYDAVTKEKLENHTLQALGNGFLKIRGLLNGRTIQVFCGLRAPLGQERVLSVQ